MKKTINISIGGLSFVVEEDAFARLESYLEGVKNHFAGFAESAEIISDIEDRIAEHFSAKAGVGKIVNLPLVEEMISAMGKPEDFGGETSHNGGSFKAGQETQSDIAGKRLMRNGGDVIVAGVASGVAAYFGIDPVWARLGFVVLTLISGFGILLYIVLWIILPEARTDTEKMQMRGERVNLKNLETAIKERAEEFKKKDAGKLKSGIARLAQAFARVARAIFVGLGKLFGVLLAAASGLFIAGLLMLSVGLLVNGNSPYIDFPLRDMAQGGIFYAAVFSAFVVGFVPLLFLAMFGASLLSGRLAFGKGGGFGLLALWIVAGIVFANVAIKLAPQVESAYNNSPEYMEESREISQAGFSGVNAGGNFEVEVYPAPSYRVVASGSVKDLDGLSFSQKNGILEAGSNASSKFCLFCIRKPVRLEIYTPALNELRGHGASRFTAFGFSAADFKLELSGASQAQVQVNAQNVRGSLSGASRAELTGQAAALDFELSGASNMEATDMSVLNAMVKLSGASKIYFGDLDSLKAKASGASRVYFKSAKSVQQELSGASMLKSASVFSTSTDFEVYPFEP